MNNLVHLEIVKESDIAQLHALQVESFMPLYNKYHDEGSPAIEPMEKLRNKVLLPERQYYFIVKYGIRIGAIGIEDWSSKANRSVFYISPIFIIPSWQDKGLGYAAMQQALNLHPEATEWYLTTILQEPRNCHFYEKCGFVRTGGSRVINDMLTLVDYALIRE